MNRIDLIGNLTKNCELAKTRTGTPVANFTLACDKPYKTTGEKTADFFRCEIFGKSAENLAQYTQKGSKLFVTGYLIFQDYESSDGTPQRAMIVRAQSIKYLSRTLNDNSEDQQESEELTNQDPDQTE